MLNQDPQIYNQNPQVNTQNIQNQDPKRGEPFSQEIISDEPLKD